VVFLGAPRSVVAEHAHECGRPMRGAMVALAAMCVAIGLAPLVFWQGIARAAGAWNGAWTGTDSPAPLGELGRVHVGLVLVALVAGGWLWRVVRLRGLVRDVTWDCGYAQPTARMQYTAGSFAGVITEWFAFILRPELHEHLPEGGFPASANRTGHTPETVLEWVVEPVGRTVIWISSQVRRLQHGRVQFYIVYVLIGMLALAAWVCLDGKP